MAEPRRFLRPIEELEGDLERLCSALDKVPNPAALPLSRDALHLGTELIVELRDWRALLTQYAESNGPARFTVIAGPAGVGMQTGSIPTRR